MLNLRINFTLTTHRLTFWLFRLFPRLPPACPSALVLTDCATAQTWTGSGLNGLLYGAGAGRMLRRQVRILRDEAMVNITDAAPSLASWTSGGDAPRRPLKLVDPYRMADWIDARNQSTPWQIEGSQYKDRGVTIKYDAPEPSNLNQWRRPL